MSLNRAPLSHRNPATARISCNRCHISNTLKVTSCTIPGTVECIQNTNDVVKKRKSWKVKSTLKQATKAQRGSRDTALLFLTLALDGSGWSMPQPSHLNPGKETPYPLYRRLGGAQGQSWCVWKILTPMEFNPWTVQPVVSRYTNYAILAQ